MNSQQRNMHFMKFIDNTRNNNLKFSLNGFQKGIANEQLSNAKSIKKLSFKYLNNFQSHRNQIEMESVDFSETTTFVGLKNIFKLFFNMSEGYKNLTQKCYLEIKSKYKLFKKENKTQLNLIIKKDKIHNQLLKDLEKEFKQRKREYDFALKISHKPVTSEQIINRSAEIRMKKDENQSDSQIEEFIRLKEKIYLQALENYNRELEYYKNISLQERICNFKIYFETIFTQRKDTMENYTKLLRVILENFIYLEKELHKIINLVDPLKDAQNIINQMCEKKEKTEMSDIFHDK